MYAPPCVCNANFSRTHCAPRLALPDKRLTSLDAGARPRSPAKLEECSGGHTPPCVRRTLCMRCLGCAPPCVCAARFVHRHPFLHIFCISASSLEKQLALLYARTSLSTTRKKTRILCWLQAACCVIRLVYADLVFTPPTLPTHIVHLGLPRSPEDMLRSTVRPAALSPLSNNTPAVA